MPTIYILLRAVLASLLALSIGAHPVGASQVGQVKLSPVVGKLLDDPVTSDAERRSLAVFHGQWGRVEDPSTQERAQIALQQYKLDDPVLTDDATDTLVRAHAATERGEPDKAVRWLTGEGTTRAVLLRATAMTQLGRVDEAAAELAGIRDRLEDGSIEGAAELTAAAEALAILALLEGRPAQDYKLCMRLLGRARGELDQLYWPAYLAEARLLWEKDNPSDAVKAVVEALSLNPQSGACWHLLGSIMARGYNFDEADRCVAALRRINPEHPLAYLLEADIFLQQKDPSSAAEAIAAILDRYPNHRPAVARLAAIAALRNDSPAVEESLVRYDALTPSGAEAYYQAGKFLSLARQYPAGEAMLLAAIERAPNRPAPRVELGLLRMQAGDEVAAEAELRKAVRLDPFNKRARNQLALAEELAKYERIETEHFVIKFQEGVDRVLAGDMALQLEDVFREVTAAFGHRPAKKTLIEILPDERHFAVRITGMPEIWTIAACTGDVIALTPPRQGARQHGAFDWLRVVRHEYVHTVTLNQTGYRIPHWFTEACAVSQEQGGRSFDDCRLLAWAVAEEELFDLEQIDWAFVRPKTPRDRPLAYAQANWMLEYITHRHGHSAVLSLLDRFAAGDDAVTAIRIVLGDEPDSFLQGFKAWAQEQVSSWGMATVPVDPQTQHLIDTAQSEPTAVDPNKLDEMLQEHPDHPDLLKLRAQHAINTGDARQALPALMRYAAARPVDPWPDTQIVRLALAAGDGEQAAASLRSLDEQEQSSGKWARQLVRIHREAGRLDEAAAAATRALQREPYNATYRELAAAVQLQRGDTDAALHHLKSMAILEPDRAIHQTRLAALYAKLGREASATDAARHAKRLDPAAPVDKYLPE